MFRKETLTLNSNSPGITTECAGLCRDEVFLSSTFFRPKVLYCASHLTFLLRHHLKSQGADCPAFSIDYNGQRCFSLDRNTQVFEAMYHLVHLIFSIWCQAIFGNFDAISCANMPDPPTQGRGDDLVERDGTNYFEKICLRGNIDQCRDKAWQVTIFPDYFQAMSRAFV